MDVNGFRKAAHAAVEQIAAYYESMEQYPVSAQVEPNFLRNALPNAPPDEGEEWETISKDYQDLIMPGVTHWQHPSFFGWFPANACFEGILADMHVGAISNPGFNWTCSPSVTELEIVCLDWVARMFALDEAFLSTSSSGNGGGIILGSASEVAITVAIAARERALGRLVKAAKANGAGGNQPNGASNGTSNGTNGSHINEEVPDASDEEAIAAWRGRTTSKLVMYGTTETHSIGIKACMCLGLAFRALPVSKEDNFALRGETLRAALEEDRAKGRTPFMLIATVGTTSSGAIDNLAEIADVAKDHPDLWLHCDAAYAGVCLALPEMRQVSHLETINSSFDSFSTNLHKWGLVQFDCSPLHVRDRSALSNALTVTPAYLRTRQADASSVLDLRNFQMPLGRRFRSLKVWFVLRSFGVKGFQAHIRSGIKLAQRFEAHVSKRPDFEICAPTHFSLVVFRLHPSDVPTAGAIDPRLEALNERFMEEIEARGSEILLVSTSVPTVGKCLRFVVGTPSTKEVHVDRAWKLIEECADKALKARAQGTLVVKA